MVTGAATAAERRREGAIAFDRSRLSAAKPAPGRTGSRDAMQREQKLRAVATVLDGFGVFDEMSYEDQHKLMNAILSVFFDDGQA